MSTSIEARQRAQRNHILRRQALRAEARARGDPINYHKPHHSPQEQEDFAPPDPTILKMSEVEIAIHTENQTNTHTKPRRARIAIRYAYSIGWRVDPTSGKVTSGRGQQYWPAHSARSSYLSISLKLPGEHKYKTTIFHAKHLAAYCYYGEMVMAPHVIIQFIDGNTLNISKTNLRITTRSRVALKRYRKTPK